MIRETLSQHGAHRLLGGAVGDGHRRHISLLVGNEFSPKEGPNDLTGEVGRGRGGRDECVVVWDHFFAGAGAGAAAGAAAGEAAGSGTGLADKVRR